MYVKKLKKLKLFFSINNHSLLLYVIFFIKFKPKILTFSLKNMNALKIYFLFFCLLFHIIF